jgi:carbon-monoxide dehydrogenase medium subunit
VALALDASFVIAGASGRRTVSAADFGVDMFTTAVGADEVLVEVRFPRLSGWGTHYEKFHRVAQAWALVGVAAAVRRDNGSIAEARIALTNMGPKAVRATAVEQALAGAPTSADAIASATRSVAEGTAPADDLSASAEYRRHLATVLTARAVTRAAGL